MSEELNHRQIGYEEAINDIEDRLELLLDVFKGISSDEAPGTIGVIAGICAAQQVVQHLKETLG